MSFRKIIGNINSINFLKRVFLNQSDALVYLFYGQEGIGKRLVAYNLAKAINCPNQKDFEPCDECPSCRKIDSGNHPDIFYIAPTPPKPAKKEQEEQKEHLSISPQNKVFYSEIPKEWTIKIEQILDLRERIYMKTYEANKKVFIIDNAERLTLEAANACLKILEEPPSDCLFILISSQPKLIISTILSRCRRIGFVPLERKELERILLNDFKLEEDLAHYLAYFCEGRIGKAISLSKEPDVLVRKNRTIDEFLTPSLYENKDINKEKIRESIKILLSWFRDLYLVKTSGIVKELINIDRREQIIRQAHSYSCIELEEIINFISEIFLFLEKNINPKLLWSNLKIRILR